MITFPQPLENLLNGSDLQPDIRRYANLVGKILADNKLPFFPYYTDHGIDHINQVLAAEVDLVPTAVWEKSTKDARPRLLCDADAVVIIGATLLHDFAMHLREDGFLELVGEKSRFKPLPWFKDAQKAPKADLPWRELWLDYQSEAKRFSDKALGNIIGLDSVRQGWKFDKLPEDKGLWDRNHHLIIGEFIRRHHARLAHEIAVYGFPGLEAGDHEGQFSALGSSGHHLQRLADLIGLAARSHGLLLRVCQDYLDFQYPRQPKPMGCAVLYPMALLRVADYLQIDRKRTPPALLKLRNPQSPVSVQEWKKHLAVQFIGPARDPRGKTITVSPDINLTTYLQLRELLAGLQQEMDHSTALLDETYGLRGDLGLDQLKLGTRRVYSNLDDPNFRDSLPYVPERTGFSADPNLLTLLVEPLYGKEPGVGVRELMQNSVDAVRELHAWCEAHRKRVEDLDLPDQEADVQIDFIDEKGDGNWILRVTDKGIGMTADTIQNYFLRAGASFRQSPEWTKGPSKNNLYSSIAVNFSPMRLIGKSCTTYFLTGTKEFVDDDGKPRVLRAGRFGIGAFAIFLLGPRFRMWTRHVGAASSEGYYVEALGDTHLIEISRKGGLSVGTIVEVEILKESAKILSLNKQGDDYLVDGGNHHTDWFCWNWPKVSRRIVRPENVTMLPQTHTAPLYQLETPPEWSAIHPLGFDKVFWTFGDYPKLTCNGLRVSYPPRQEYPRTLHDSAYYWSIHTQLNLPKIAIIDREARLPLTIQRYSLSDDNLPFIAELYRDVTLSFIAHALVCSPTSRSVAHASIKYFKPHPLVMYDIDGDRAFCNSLLRWCSFPEYVIPTDPWLYSLLRTDSCLVFGAIDFGRDLKSFGRDYFNPLQLLDFPAAICWNTRYGSDRSEMHRCAIKFLDLTKSGFQFLGQDRINIQILVSHSWKHNSSEKIKREFMNICKQRLEWNTTKIPEKFKSEYIELRIGSTIEFSPSDCFIEGMELYRERYNFDDILYVAEIKTPPTNPQPETLLAKTWNECLGPNPIPFDPVARRQLIEKGKQHPELKRHIEKWEEMKRNGSTWVVGDAE